MTGRGARAAAAFLAALGLLAAVAPALGLRDPAAQPDGLVLRDLPPLSRATAIRLEDGTLRWVHEARRTTDGGVEYRRGRDEGRLAPAALAAEGPALVRPLYVLGTDSFGRDLLARIVHGGRVSLGVGILAALLALLLGTTIGALAGLAGRWADAALMRATDMALAVPRLFLALLLVALWGPSLATTVLVLGATSWMTAARLVRAELLSLREREFVAAARAGGAPPWRVAIRHLLPGVTSPLAIEAAFRVGDAILLEAALSFLGLGVQAPRPSWGAIVADGRHALLDAWWISTLPGLAIAATVIALQVLGERARYHAAT